MRYYIYKLWDIRSGLSFYGLTKRCITSKIEFHRKDYGRYKKGKIEHKLVFDIYKKCNGGLPNYNEEGNFICNNKSEAMQILQLYINNNICINNITKTF